MSSKFRLSVALAVVVGLLTAAMSAGAFHAEEQEYHPIDNDEFEQVWERTDLPVANIVEARTWIWGPGGYSFGMDERYDDAPDGERRVQYFDKSRMEMTWNNNDDEADEEDVDSPWNITQGLLASELITGRMQLGDDTFRQFHPSMRSAAGDPQDTTAPTYAAFGNLMDRDAREGENVIIEHADRSGVITAQEERFAHYGVSDVASGEWQDIEGIDHNIADVFWNFMISEGVIWDGENYADDQPIFLNAFYAVGYPLTDAFWADVRVDGQVQDVLIQAFERRVLTYTPGNPEGWEVESGNIGQHYYDWRYNQIGEPLPGATIQFDPVDATNTVGTAYTLTATLHDDGVAVDVNDVNDVNVTIDRDNGTNDIGETVDVVDGVVEISYTGPGSPAVDTINVQIEHAGDTVEGSTTKTWAVVDPDLSLALEQDEDFNLVGTDHTITATLTANGEPVEGAEIQFFIDHSVESVPGIGPGGFGEDVDEPLLTDEQGQYSFTYTRTTAGTETIEAFHPNPFGIASEPASLTKTWQEFEDFYQCDDVVVDGESIQSAINNSDDGDTICVMEGTYSEALNITGSDSLRLQGEGSDLVTIDASAASGYGISGDFSSTEWGSDVVLMGFTLYGPRQGVEAQNFGLKMSNIDGLWIEDVHVYESRRTGIDVFSATNVTMRNVESHDNDANGIAIRDSSVVSVDNASTSGNGWGGFALYAPGAEAIDDVEIANSSFEDEGAGIYLQDSDHTNISIVDSIFTGNGVGIGFSTVANEAPAVDILGNIFTGNTTAIGVNADVDVSNIVINNNSIAGNDDGVVNNGVNTLDAVENWWGNADGPSGAGPGTGDSVSTGVDFSDWLTADPF